MAMDTFITQTSTSWKTTYSHDKILKLEMDFMATGVCGSI